MAEFEQTIPIDQVTPHITVKVNLRLSGMHSFRIRYFIGTHLMRFAASLMRVKLSIETD